MLLKKSSAYRRTRHAGLCLEIDADWVVPNTGDRDIGIEFRFDMGTDAHHEKLALLLHNSDFRVIAKLMAEADREKAIQAFSRALIGIKPKS